MSFQEKYLKYKNKYLELKKQSGGQHLNIRLIYLDNTNHKEPIVKESINIDVNISLKSLAQKYLKELARDYDLFNEEIVYIVVNGEIVDENLSLDTLFSHHDNNNKIDESDDNNDISVMHILYKYNLPGDDYLKIPEGTTNIVEKAFFNKKFTNVKIPDSITSIGDASFFGNKLTHVKIPDSVTSIGRNAFARNQLTSVTIGNKVESIRSYAFFTNQLQGSVTIPDSVTRIDLMAFSNNQLTSVTIPDSVITIGNGAFMNNKLTSVTMPSRFNTNEHKARIFDDDFRNITFNIT